MKNTISVVKGAPLHSVATSFLGKEKILWMPQNLDFVLVENGLNGVTSIEDWSHYG
jgi:hypothetical protein